MRNGLKLSFHRRMAGSHRLAHAADDLNVGTPEGTAFMFAVLDVGNGAGIFAKHDLTVEKLNFAGGGKIGEAIVGCGRSHGLGQYRHGFRRERRAGESGRDDDRRAGRDVDHRPHGWRDRQARRSQRQDHRRHLADLAHLLAGARFPRDHGWGPDGVKRAYIGSMTSEVAGLLTKNVDAIVGPVEGGYILEAKAKRSRC